MSKTVIVLGAGATRGASFVDHEQNPCLPPLDGDFFTQFQRITNSKHNNLVKQVIADTVGLFGTNFGATLETVFTTIEHTTRMLEATGSSREFAREDLKEKRERLMQAIAATLESALTKQVATGQASLGLLPCEYTDNLVRLLTYEDTIISFNYDCLIDDSLKRCGDKKWHPRYGYGVPLGSHGSRLIGDKRWSPVIPGTEVNTIHLFKLQGSLNFLLSGNTLTLKERPYTKQRGNLQFTIIPPEFQKAYNTTFFVKIWQKAASAIHRAENLIFIGYSLPEADMHAAALLRVHVSKESLKNLVVVNPDPLARKRIREVVRRGLSPKTKVYSFDTVKEFSTLPRTLWDSP